MVWNKPIVIQNFIIEGRNGHPASITAASIRDLIDDDYESDKIERVGREKRWEHRCFVSEWHRVATDVLIEYDNYEDFGSSVSESPFEPLRT